MGDFSGFLLICLFLSPFVYTIVKFIKAFMKSETEEAVVRARNLSASELTRTGFNIQKSYHFVNFDFYADNSAKKWALMDNMRQYRIFHYSDLINFEVTENGMDISQGISVLTGLAFGAAGAVAGAAGDNRICENMEVRLYVNDFEYPQIRLAVSSKHIKYGSSAYRECVEMVKDFISTLTYIKNNASENAERHPDEIAVGNMNTASHASAATDADVYGVNIRNVQNSPRPAVQPASKKESHGRIFQKQETSRARRPQNDTSQAGVKKLFSEKTMVIFYAAIVLFLIILLAFAPKYFSGNVSSAREAGVSDIAAVTASNYPSSDTAQTFYTATECVEKIKENLKSDDIAYISVTNADKIITIAVKAPQDTASSLSRLYKTDSEYKKAWDGYVEAARKKGGFYQNWMKNLGRSDIIIAYDVCSYDNTDDVLISIVAGSVYYNAADYLK